MDLASVIVNLSDLAMLGGAELATVAPRASILSHNRLAPFSLAKGSFSARWTADIKAHTVAFRKRDAHR